MSSYADRQRHWEQLRARQAAEAEHRARTAHLRREIELERLRALYADTPDTPRVPRKRKWTEEQRRQASINTDRERMSRQARAWWRTLKSDPARYEAMCRNAAKKARLMWTPERCAEQAERMRQKWESDEWRAIHSAMLKARWTEEARAEQAERMRQKWTDKDARAEHRRKFHQAWTAEHSAKQSQRAKRAWTPERRAQWAEIMRAKKLAEAAADTRPARAVAMRQEGALIRDIAEELGVHKGTVGRWLKRAKEAGEL